MRSPLAERERDRVIEAMLPDVAFDGWTRAALRVASRQLAMPFEEAVALFPRGAPDLAPLWMVLDSTPEGRGADWYPKLGYP